MQDLVFEQVLDRYLKQCRVRNTLVEDEQAHVPPTKEEVSQLITHLRQRKMDPVIVGSVGVLHHLGNIDVRKKFRPTVDLDVWVKRDPGQPPQGWARDVESPGITSWISPSGGYVDFMTPGHEFPSGERSPSTVGVHEPSGDFPVATVYDLIRMKLNSMRPKDLTDIIALVRKLGHVPEGAEIGHLNQTQRENYDLVKQWFKLRPTGDYDE